VAQGFSALRIFRSAEGCATEVSSRDERVALADAHLNVRANPGGWFTMGTDPARRTSVRRIAYVDEFELGCVP
jgi:hypothetical protein